MVPILIFVVVLTIVFYFIIKRVHFTKNNVDKNTDGIEKYSYNFGFPTWGQINNQVPSYYNPFMWPYYSYTSPIIQPVTSVIPQLTMPYYRSRPYDIYPPISYFYDSILPYLNNRCYSSYKEEDCAPGYYKKHIGDEKSDVWKCCRGY